MKVIVAEKPSVAKGIAQIVGATTRHGSAQYGYLEGNGYQVTWCFGHLIELCMADAYDQAYAKWNIEDLPILPDPFKRKISGDSAEQQFNYIKDLINNADEVIEATDAGREGELIFRLVYNFARCKTPCKRLWISSLEPAAIKRGLNELKPLSDYDDLYAAAISRQEADWLLGINCTRWYSCGYNIKLTTGRVQTPTLNEVVKRELEILNFKPTPYWMLNADLGEFIVSRKETDPQKADTCYKACTGGTAVITDVEKKTQNENPKPLYDITSLQMDANKIFGYTAEQTLNLAQSLYEQRLATYPRTDSRYITAEQKSSVQHLIEDLKDKGFWGTAADFSPYNIDRIINDKKVSDHHAILPTVELTKSKFDGLKKEEQNVLLLIVWKLLMAVAPTYTYETTKVMADISGYEFTGNGKKDIVAGFKTVERAFKKVLGAGDKGDNPLPEILVGNKYPVKNLEKEEKMTTPPARYTDATLLGVMETCGKAIDDQELKDAMKDKGLGTPATRANIIESLIKVGYLERKKKVLVPTEKAFKFIEIVNDTLKQPELTASWEYQLALIQKGQLRRSDFMAGVTAFLKKFCDETEVDKSKVFSRFKSIGKCPNCKADIGWGEYGAFCNGKCGFMLKQIYGKKLTEKQATDLLAGKKVLIKDLISKKTGNPYDAYFSPKGLSEFSYTKQDGTTAKGLGFDYDMTFPDKKKK